MTPLPSEVRLFLETVSGGAIHGYDEASAQNKTLFHTCGRQLLKRLATDLDYRTGEYDIRSNPAGIAVCGEVTFHSDDLYIQLSKSRGDDLGILYRTCQGRTDYRGGHNHWLPFPALKDYLWAVAVIRNVRRVSCS